jgi:hypothetical protein
MWMYDDPFADGDVIVDVFTSNEEAHVFMDYLIARDAEVDEDEPDGSYVIVSRRLYETGQEAIDDHRAVYGTP